MDICISTITYFDNITVLWINLWYGTISQYSLFKSDHNFNNTGYKLISWKMYFSDIQARKLCLITFSSRLIKNVLCIFKSIRSSSQWTVESSRETRWKATRCNELFSSADLFDEAKRWPRAGQPRLPSTEDTCGPVSIANSDVLSLTNIHSTRPLQRCWQHFVCIADENILCFSNIISCLILFSKSNSASGVFVYYLLVFLKQIGFL